jgi:AAA family ATP:ADP antiporter
MSEVEEEPIEAIEQIGQVTPESLLHRLTHIQPDEMKVVLWAIVYYFCLMCSYFIIKPLRDEMGVISGVENLQYLFTGTFVVMLLMVPVFGWISSHYPREKFLPYVYLFFISNIIIFYILFQSEIEHVYVARAFYIWVSVYNLFVVSVFWSLLSEIFSSNQAKRLFAIIAMGGTAGGIVGPLLTASLVTFIGTENLLIVSAAFLIIALISVNRLHTWHEHTIRESRNGDELDKATDNESKMDGGILAGVKLVINSPYLMGICCLILLQTAMATFLYFQQLTIVDNVFDDPTRRTAIFSMIELLTNGLTLFLQFMVTRKIVNSFGIAPILALLPILLCFGFLALWMAPSLGVIIAVQVIRRAGNYSINRPVREMLYTVLRKEEKYKAKNFIDTAIYRGGDMTSAWIYNGLSTVLGLSLSAIALIAIPASAAWSFIAFKVGKAQENKVREKI